MKRVKVAIVGTGFSGLGMAIKLKKNGIDDFVIFERAGDVGGTWRDNIYPGCQCDVPSSLYSFSFALNPGWSRTYPPQQEIWDYLRDCTRRYDIEPHIRFNHEVLTASWDESENVWTIETSAGSCLAEVLILGNGGLSEPSIPELPGREDFKGAQLHSGAWDPDVDLAGKKIAVVGTGASAIQIVPELQPIADELVVFQRTPAWILPHPDRATTAFERKLYRRVPLAQKLSRAFVYLSRELLVLGMTRNRRFLAPLRMAAERHMRKQISDPKLRRQLRPHYSAGCKRLLISNDFYPAIQSPNAKLVAEGITGLTANGVVSSSGETHEVDVVVWATGFHVTDNPVAHRVKGRDGATLADAWNTGGMKAYLGATIHGFPNMFMLTGPNTGQGHTSLVYMAESQMSYIADALDFMSRNDVASVEVTVPATEAYNHDIDERMKRSVWTTGGCKSWYLDTSGRNPTLWPDFTWRFRAMTKRFDSLSYLVRARA